MDVRVVCVPMIDGDPVKAGAKVGFHLRGEVARERAKVRHLASVFGRDDEPEVVAIILRSIREGQIVGSVAARVEHHRFLAVTCDARSEEHTSELQSLMRISYAVFCLQKKRRKTTQK